jgi:hypothetical protein
MKPKESFYTYSIYYHENEVITCILKFSGWLNRKHVYNLDILEETFSRVKDRPLLTVTNHISCFDEPLIWGKHDMMIMKVYTAHVWMYCHLPESIDYVNRNAKVETCDECTANKMVGNVQDKSTRIEIPIVLYLENLSIICTPCYYRAIGADEMCFFTWLLSQYFSKGKVCL